MTDAISYVVNASYFWSLMGWTTATAIFIGGLLYNGDLKLLGKGMATVGSYAVLLFLVTMARVGETVASPNYIPDPAKAWAGMTTIVFITLFYILGLIIGVLTIKNLRQK